MAAEGSVGQASHLVQMRNGLGVLTILDQLRADLEVVHRDSCVCVSVRVDSSGTTSSPAFALASPPRAKQSAETRRGWQNDPRQHEEHTSVPFRIPR